MMRRTLDFKGDFRVGTAFWIRRFLSVFAGAFVVIAAVQLLKGRDVGYATLQALVWAAAAATIFTTSRIYQSRRGQHCAICKDTPEMQDVGAGPKLD